jgi:hypothetical protein
MPQTSSQPFVAANDINYIKQYTLIAGGTLVNHLQQNVLAYNFIEGIPNPSALIRITGTPETNATNITNATTQLNTLTSFFDSITLSTLGVSPLPTMVSNIYAFSPGIYYNSGDFFVGAGGSCNVTFTDPSPNVDNQIIIIINGSIIFGPTVFLNNNLQAYNVIWYATNNITTNFLDTYLFGVFISKLGIFIESNTSRTDITANFYVDDLNNITKQNITINDVPYGGTLRPVPLTNIYNLLVTACFLKGTLILTEHGYVAIEDIKVGDELVSNGSILDNKTPKQTGDELKKVIWKGKQTIKNIDRETNPIVIKKHTLGKNTPFQDLSVSPNHGLVVDDAFRPARDFINNDTILEDNETKELEYYHLELEGHCIISANGVLTESYLDFGNRYFFISQ